MNRLSCAGRSRTRVRFWAWPTARWKRIRSRSLRAIRSQCSARATAGLRGQSRSRRSSCRGAPITRCKFWRRATARVTRSCTCSAKARAATAAASTKSITPHSPRVLRRGRRRNGSCRVTSARSAASSNSPAAVGSCSPSAARFPRGSRRRLPVPTTDGTTPWSISPTIRARPGGNPPTCFRSSSKRPTSLATVPSSRCSSNSVTAASGCLCATGRGGSCSRFPPVGSAGRRWSGRRSFRRIPRPRCCACATGKSCC